MNVSTVSIIVGAAGAIIALVLLGISVKGHIDAVRNLGTEGTNRQQIIARPYGLVQTSPDAAPIVNILSFDSLFRLALFMLLIPIALLWFGIAHATTDEQKVNFAIFDSATVCDASVRTPRVSAENGVVPVSFDVQHCRSKSNTAAKVPALTPTLDVGTPAKLTPPAPAANSGQPSRGTYVSEITLQPTPPVAVSAIMPQARKETYESAPDARTWQWFVASSGADQALSVVFTAADNTFISPPLLLHGTASKPWVSDALSTFTPLAVGLVGLFGMVGAMMKTPGTQPSGPPH